MTSYVEQYGKQPVAGAAESVIRTIAKSYMKRNPPVPFSYRAYSEKGFKCDENGAFILDFDNKFPEAADGDYAYAFSKVYSYRTGVMALSVRMRVPVEIYVNGEKVTQTTCYDEGCDEVRNVQFNAKQGMNTVFVKCRKNAIGFQCRLGVASIKWGPTHFYTPFAENEGELGWNYCGPFHEDVFKEPPSEKDPMADCWLPKPYDPAIPITQRGELYAVSKLSCTETAEVRVQCKADADIELYINGQLLSKGYGALSAASLLEEGIWDIAIHLTGIKDSCSFDCQVENGNLMLPDYVKAAKGDWLYLETADAKARYGFRRFELYDSFVPGEKTSFQCGADTYIRPVLETEIYGKATYPLGVVLYGLLMAGKYLQDQEILEYAHRHLESCYTSLHYSLWDKEKFGFACINHQLQICDTLDDCGAFAATVMEDYLRYSKDEAVLPFADYVADYILNKHERLDNGMFYRKMPVPYFRYTIWCDDLYMSTPFMLRYAQLTGNSAVIDDVVNQFLCYQEKLYMPDAKLMSHVYNTLYDRPTRMPWGRGNGWVLFSLTELLAVLPKEHVHYEKIKVFFTNLAEGFLNNIDEDGMIHQLIWDKDAYQEASSTAMCAAGFARGVRMGLLPKEPYQAASERCVEALRKRCVDEEGNVYGVCHGSLYSYRAEYYKYELVPIVNDTHGTGIFLIAMVEVDRNRQAQLD